MSGWQQRAEWAEGVLEAHSDLIIAAYEVPTMETRLRQRIYELEGVISRLGAPIPSFEPHGRVADHRVLTEKDVRGIVHDEIKATARLFNALHGGTQ